MVFGLMRRSPIASPAILMRMPLFVHSTWVVDTHPREELGPWDPQKANLVCSVRQAEGKADTAAAVERALHGRTTLCADRLDWLIANQHEIPPGFKSALIRGTHICFWATRFNGKGVIGDGRFIRVMYWSSRGQCDSYGHLISRGIDAFMASAIYEG